MEREDLKTIKDIYLIRRSMRKQFFSTLENLAIKDGKIVFLTGDVGFMACESLQKAIGKRFINCGVAEANMMSMAAAMASQGLKPVVYSIAPFVTARCLEQIKIDVCLHNMNVKIVGNGGGYGYGIMGATHHSIEDIALMSCLQNMKCYVPFCNEDTSSWVNQMMYEVGPGYLRLGYGESNMMFPIIYPIRKLSAGDKATIIGLGPVILNAKAMDCDVYAVSEIPCKLDGDVIRSIKKTRKVLVIEEHVERGGLAEHLALQLSESQLIFKFRHLCAHGYPNGLYGSQAYHQQINGLDRKSIEEAVNGI